MGDIPNVTPELFSSKCTSGINYLYDSFSPLIFPATKLCILVCILVLILAAISGSKELKKFGWGGIITVIVVNIFFYFYPLIFGLFHSAGNTINPNSSPPPVTTSTPKSVNISK